MYNKSISLSYVFSQNQIHVLLLLEEILHQLRLVVYPTICKVLYIQTVVVWDFWTINSIICSHLPPGRDARLAATVSETARSISTSIGTTEDLNFVSDKKSQLQEAALIWWF